MYYCDAKHIVIFSNLFSQKALRLKTKLIIEKRKRVIKVTQEPFNAISNNEKKKLKIVQGTQINLLKQMLLDISHSFCIKLNLIGVGFRVFVLKLFDLDLLHFKLGYSYLF